MVAACMPASCASSLKAPSPSASYTVAHLWGRRRGAVVSTCMRSATYVHGRAPSEDARARLVRHDTRDALGGREAIELPDERHELCLALGDERAQPLGLKARVAPLEIRLHLCMQ